MSRQRPHAIEIKGVNLTPGLTPFEQVRYFLDHISGNKLSYDGFDKTFIKDDMKLLSAVLGEVVFEMVVKDIHADGAGVLHVGAMALMFDISTSVALIPSAKSGYWEYFGVSRNINVTSLNPAPVGTTLIITSTVVAVDEKLATIKGVAVDKDSGKVICTVEHLKFDVGAPMGKL